LSAIVGTDRVHDDEATLALVSLDIFSNGYQQVAAVATSRSLG
jgi:hypothetical protein